MHCVSSAIRVIICKICNAFALYKGVYLTMNRSCKELKRIARENLSGQYRTSMGAILAMGIIPLAVELPFSMLQNSGQPIGQTIIFYVADFLISFITFLLSVGVIYFNLHIARRKKPAFGMVFHAFKNHPDRFLLAGILLTLLTVAAAVPFGAGALLFYVKDLTAGAVVCLVVLAVVSILLIAFVQLQYALTVYFMLDHSEMGVIEALRSSRKAMKGNRGRLLYQFFSFLGLHVLSILSIGIGYLWVLPYQFQTMANLYLDITGELDSMNERQSATREQGQPSFNQYI